MDTTALPEQGVDKPPDDVAGGSGHAHRLVLLRRAAAALPVRPVCLDLALHLI